MYKKGTQDHLADVSCEAKTTVRTPKSKAVGKDNICLPLLGYVWHIIAIKLSRLII